MIKVSNNANELEKTVEIVKKLNNILYVCESFSITSLVSLFFFNYRQDWQEYYIIIHLTQKVVNAGLIFFSVGWLAPILMDGLVVVNSSNENLKERSQGASVSIQMFQKRESVIVKLDADKSSSVDFGPSASLYTKRGSEDYCATPNTPATPTSVAEPKSPSFKRQSTINAGMAARSDKKFKLLSEVFEFFASQRLKMVLQIIPLICQVIWPYARSLSAYTIPFFLIFAGVGVSIFTNIISQLDDGLIFLYIYVKT